jgi:hypothetical protein
MRARLPTSMTDSADYAISMLLARPNIRCRNIKPETQLSMDVADAFRRHINSGAYKGIFTHIPNEGKRTKLMNCILKSMGMISGATDFVFAWENHSVWIELKVPGKGLEYNQEWFAMWCRHSKVSHALCHSVSEVEGVIRALGGLG